MTTKIFDRAYVRSSGSTVSLYSASFELRGENAVSISAEATSITQDVALTVEGGNDEANWTTVAGSTGTLTTATGYVQFRVAGLAFRFVRLAAQMSASGLAIVSANLETSRQ